MSSQIIRDCHRFYSSSSGIRMFQSLFDTCLVQEYKQREFQYISSLLQKSDFQHVVEVGCGPGVYAQTVVDHQLTYTGIDIVDWAEERLSSVNCRYYVGSIESFVGSREFEQLHRGLFIFPFNCGGNIEDLSTIVDKILGIDCELVLSLFVDEAAVVAEREQYYAECGAKGLRYRETFAGGMISDNSGLRSIAFSERYLSGLMKDGRRVSRQRLNDVGQVITIAR